MSPLLTSVIKKMSRHTYVFTQSPGLGTIQALDHYPLIWRLFFHVSPTADWVIPVSKQHFRAQSEYIWGLLRLCETHRLRFSRGSYTCIFLHQCANSPAQPGQRSSPVPWSPLQTPRKAAGKKRQLPSEARCLRKDCRSVMGNRKSSVAV